MDHTEAIEGKFTERYLLGELTPAQRDQFEEHFFDCIVCADDVESGAVFVANARELLRKEPVSEEAASFPTLGKAQSAFARYGLPFQSAAWAFVLLLCVVGYENVVTIPNLKARSSGVRSPEILPTVSLLGMGARTETNPVAAPGAKDFVLEMEIPGGPEFSSYLCEIRDAAANLKYAVPVGSTEAKETVRLAIPGAALTAGNYQLVVLGKEPDGSSKKLVQYNIQIQ
jgi:hypothetical protein